MLTIGIAVWTTLFAFSTATGGSFTVARHVPLNRPTSPGVFGGLPIKRRDRNQYRRLLAVSGNGNDGGSSIHTGSGGGSGGGGLSGKNVDSSDSFGPSRREPVHAMVDNHEKRNDVDDNIAADESSSKLEPLSYNPEPSVFRKHAIIKSLSKANEATIGNKVFGYLTIILIVFTAIKLSIPLSNDLSGLGGLVVNAVLVWACIFSGLPNLYFQKRLRDAKRHLYNIGARNTIGSEALALREYMKIPAIEFVDVKDLRPTDLNKLCYSCGKSLEQNSLSGKVASYLVLSDDAQKLTRGFCHEECLYH